MAKKVSNDSGDIELSRAEFIIEGDFSNPDDLEKVAWEAFFELRVSAYERYEGKDVGLKVHAEEGSAEVAAWVIGTIGGLYGALAQYKDVKAGISELTKDAKYVAKRVLSIARVRKAKEKGELQSFTADAGAIGKVEMLFKRVRNGKMSREQGESLALELLERFGEIPNETKEAMQNSFRTMKVAGVQTRIPDEEEVEYPKRLSTVKLRKPRTKKTEWSVDIESRNRSDPPTVIRNKL